MRYVNLIVAPLLVLGLMTFGLIRSNEIVLGLSIASAFIAFMLDRHLRLNY